MRLSYVAFGQVIRKANIKRYPEFINMGDSHLDDLNARVKGFSHEFDVEIRDRLDELRTNLNGMLSQLRSPKLAGGNSYFASMQRIGDMLHAFCLVTLGEQYENVVENVKTKVRKDLRQRKATLDSMTLDDICFLRFRVQDLILAETRRAGESLIVSIVDDIDQGFATKYFALDQILLSAGAGTN